MQIVTLDPENWQLFRQIRLEALRTDPQAFSSRLAETEQRPDSHWQTRLAQAQEGKNSWLLFAREGDRIVGIIGAFREQGETPATGSPTLAGVVEIYSVFVRPEARGKGVGTALMAAVLDAAGRAEGARRARLTVNAAQSAAVALYRRFGFQVVEEREGILGDGKTCQELVMEKELSPLRRGR